MYDADNYFWGGVFADSETTFSIKIYKNDSTLGSLLGFDKSSSEVHLHKVIFTCYTKSAADFASQIHKKYSSDLPNRVLKNIPS